MLPRNFNIAAVAKSMVFDWEDPAVVALRQPGRVSHAHVGNHAAGFPDSDKFLLWDVYPWSLWVLHLFRNESCSGDNLRVWVYNAQESKSLIKVYQEDKYRSKRKKAFNCNTEERKAFQTESALSQRKVYLGGLILSERSDHSKALFFLRLRLATFCLISHRFFQGESHLQRKCFSATVTKLIKMNTLLI